MYICVASFLPMLSAADWSKRLTLVMIYLGDFGNSGVRLFAKNYLQKQKSFNSPLFDCMGA